MRILMIFCLLLSMACTSDKEEATAAKTPETAIQTGVWRATLISPGGELPFKLTIDSKDGIYHATAYNGDEALPFDQVTINGSSVEIAIEHYESVFRARLNEAGTRMEGEWSKVIGTGEFSRLPFFADHGVDQRFAFKEDATVSVAGRWAVTFDNNEDEPQPAIAVFQQDGNHLLGTFLTPTGDYRYLEGTVTGNTLYLSCFDGGHAFLFKATLTDDRLNGDFWSRDTWHETWSAVRNEEAALPDAYSMTAMRPGRNTLEFNFPDLQGRLVTQDAPYLQDKVRLVTVFGSWCPNCNDEAPFLQELYEQYGDRGFEVLGLAFELTQNVERNKRVLSVFKKRHGLTYPILLAGNTKDKTEATRIIGGLDNIQAYPTTILLNRAGEVVSIHTGFSGPGTGAAHIKLKESYRQSIEALL